MFCLLLYNLGIKVVGVIFIRDGLILGSCCIVRGSLLGLLALVRGFAGIGYRVIRLCVEVSVCFLIIGLCLLCN